MLLAVADVRRVDEAIDGPFDAAISCDNALPHLLTNADLSLAIGSIRACLHDGAVFLASIRDYGALAQSRPAWLMPSQSGYHQPLVIAVAS